MHVITLCEDAWASITPSKKQDVSACPSFILTSAERADGAPHMISLLRAKTMVLMCYNASFPFLKIFSFFDFIISAL